jgi:signal transduction histidine kinase
MKHRFYLLFFVCTAVGWSFAGNAQQTRIIDSIKAVLNTNRAGRPEEKAALYIKLTREYLNQSDYINASNCIQKSLSIAENISNDTLLAQCYKFLGMVEMNQRNFSRAVEYNTKALDIYIKKSDTANQASIIKNLGDDYLQHHDSVSAGKYYEQALNLFLQVHDKQGEASVYLNQATVVYKDYSKRIKLVLAAKKIFDGYPPDNFLPTINTGNLGIAYSELGRNKIYRTILNDPNIPATENENLEKAAYYLKLAIKMALQKNDFDNSSFYSGALAELQEYRGDFKNAYYNIRKYYETQDSIFSQENKNKIARLESTKEIDLKNKEIVNKELQLDTQRKQRIFFITGLFLLAVIGSLLFWQSRIRKKTNTTLVKLNNELNEANKTKAKFFAILSHDLRSPVASLVNFLRLQKKKPDLLTEQQVQNHEQKIEASAESLLETMETMLLWSKGQMENFKPSVQTVPVNNLFNYLEKTFSPTTQTKIAFINPAGLSVVTDENYLQTIMYNLTSNAIKALKHTEHALIEWKAFEQDGKTILSVSDNGPGLTEESMFTLFNGTTSVNAKTGLGLHLIRDLARAIQCKITVTAAPENGTMFTLFA